jgi:hypothetical protein
MLVLLTTNLCCSYHVTLQVRYFLSVDQLNLRMREARYAAAAARATWLPPGWEPPQDEEEVAQISRQAARMVNKMHALQVAQAGNSVIMLHVIVTNMLCVLSRVCIIMLA